MLVFYFYGGSVFFTRLKMVCWNREVIYGFIREKDRKAGTDDRRCRCVQYNPLPCEKNQ